MSKRVRVWLVVAACAALAFCRALPALGQVADEGVRNLNDLPYRDLEIEEMRRVCATTAGESAEIDRLLLEWKAELDPLQAQAEAEFAAYRAAPAERRMRDARERVLKSRRELVQRQEAIDTRCTRRLAQCLDREGELRWAKFERRQRRFRIMGKQEREYSAEGVDVLALVEAFGLTEEGRGPAAAVLAAYERGLALKESFERASCVGAYGPMEVSLAILAAAETPGLDEPTRARLARLAEEWAAQDKPYERLIAEMWRRFERVQLEEINAERAEWDRLRLERHERRTRTPEAMREVISDRLWEEMCAAAGRRMAVWRRERVR